MVRRVAEVDLGGLRAAEVQVRVVLPREPDAAVDLDVLGGGVEVRVRAVRLRERRGERQLVGILGGGPAGVVRGRARHLDLHEHVRALVLDRLERTDRTSELVALLRVLRRHVEARCEPPTISADSAAAAWSSVFVSAAAPVPASPSSVAGVLLNEIFACLRVMSSVCSAVRVTPSASGSTTKRLTSLPSFAATIEQVRRRAVHDVGLVTGELAAARPSPRCPRAPTCRSARRRRAPRASSRRRCREELLLLVVGAGVEDRVRGEHDRGEVRRGEELLAHLLHEDGELDEAEADTAVLLGDGHAEPAEVGHLLPRALVEALLGLHQLAHDRPRTTSPRGTGRRSSGARSALR